MVAGVLSGFMTNASHISVGGDRRFGAPVTSYCTKVSVILLDWFDA
ncbi:hypothetical protein X727_32835 [Mesorhizobium sp. L103C119B0]|nr:hypothetical protein X727_32835 [Mesorhizobium sp. L103C119B0]